MKKMETLSSLKFQCRDLGERLYYCSDTGEGRKMRRMLEKAIRDIDKRIAILESNLR